MHKRYAKLPTPVESDSMAGNFPATIHNQLRQINDTYNPDC